MDLPASSAPIALTDPSAASESSVETSGGRTAASSGNRYALPLGIASILFLGATLEVGISGWLRGVSLGLLLGSGGLVLLGLLIGLRPKPVELLEAHVDVAADLPVHSAFVCAQCGEYAPAPDWDQLLRAADLREDGAGVSRGGPVALASGVPLESTAVPLPLIELGPQPVGDLLTVADTVHRPPPAAARVSPGDREPEYVLSGGRLTLSVPPSSSWSTSGGHALPPGSVGLIPLDLAFLELPERWLDPSGRVGPTRVDATSGSESDHPSLEQWIRAETIELLATARLPISAPAESEGSSGAEDGPCAVCREAVVVDPTPDRCVDCRRPVCEPCSDRLVEHQGDAWCPPCAVNRLSSQYLDLWEESPPPASVAEPALSPAVGPLA